MQNYGEARVNPYTGEIIPLVNKYNSIDTNIADYDLTALTPNSKMVFNQWKIDVTDDLLVDGYYRQCHNISTSNQLSTDVKQIIISYYTKQYSKGTLKRKLLQLKRLADLKRQARIKKK
eukprot:200090_1